MSQKSPVLAIYDFSGKQNYIFKTTRIKEILGADAILGNAFIEFMRGLLSDKMNFKTDPKLTELLNSQCDSLQGKLSEFVTESFRDRAKTYDDYFEIADIGGGNLFLLFGSEDSCLKANRFFGKQVLEKAYDLQLVCAFVPANLDASFSKDRKNAIEKSNQIRRELTMQAPVNVLPFTLIDRRTSQPIITREFISGERRDLSWDSKGKYDQYRKLLNSKEISDVTDKILDKIVTKKGVDSLLAVIHIDGNGMGDKLKELSSKISGDAYKKAINEYRAFSRDIRVAFVDKPKEEILKYLEEKKKEKKGKKIARWLINAGDDFTIICNAHFALDLTLEYFECLKSFNKKNSERNFSCCAGIAVFHSHDPFGSAYEMAEECCSSAKKLNRKYGNDNFIFDFHTSYGSSANDFDTVRKHQEKHITLRPYVYSHPNNSSEILQHSYYSTFDKVKQSLLTAGVVRSDVKGLASKIFQGRSYFDIEIERLSSKYENLGISVSDLKAVYDVATVYDIWVDESEKVGELADEQNNNNT